MQLAEPAALDGRGLARDGGSRSASRSTCGSMRSAANSVSTAPFARPKPPSRDPGQMAALVRQLLPGREVHARDLEQRDPLVPRVDVALRAPRRARGRASSAAPPARRRADRRAAARSGSGRSRRGSTCTPRRSRRRRARPRRRRRRRWSRVSRPVAVRVGSVNGISSRWTRAISSTTSASRVTSRARHVGTTTSQVVGHEEPEPREQHAAARPRARRCRSARSRARGGSGSTGRSGSRARHVGRSREPRAGRAPPAALVA